MAYNMDLAIIKDACRVLNRVGEQTTIDNVAKYIGIPKMALISYIDANYGLFVLRKVKGGRTAKTIIQEVYVTLAEKPNTTEWVMAQRELYANTIKVTAHTYYGNLCGKEIDIDYSPNATINLEQKVLHIMSLIGITKPGWRYMFGGFTDSCMIECKGYKVSNDDIKKIKSLGYNVIEDRR